MMGADEVQDVELSHSQEQAATAEDQAQYVLDQSTLAYAGVLVSAIVLIISLTASGDLSQTKYWAYGISLGSLAMAFSLAGWLLAVKIPGQAKNVMYLNYLIFLWCFIGACIMTFGGPFLITGNGELVFEEEERCFTWILLVDWSSIIVPPSSYLV
jgi:hypothetical protein